MKVAKWGNSLAVRLPQTLVETLGLKEGDEVELSPNSARSFDVSRDRRREEALARIRELSRPLPPGFKFDRDEIYDHGRNDFRPDDDAE
jgi:antitoxin MazE